ncbi:MAG: hypothetical protein GWN29_04890 [Gammaproteobacteria bacterium]|nr:LamG domain-containing protein [Gammaproteobacteria bacterium]NIV51091.1 hypothetical protein [Gammaproteobacteria bacterium]NIW23942.1 hypothetical protein [Gammaproteobacteria bacterium]NIX85034.1 hypothetical protein [Gammaproteobacteria bacterium]
MSMLHLNGWAVPVVTCELKHQDIAGARGYSANGLYRFTRNSYARTWRCRTGLLTSAERDALLQILGHRGDGWQWDLAGDAANGVHTSSKRFYSDKFRAAQSAEEVATLESAYAADGARVYDYNGNTMALHDGAEGMLHVDPGSTNILTANQSHPTANGHLTDYAANAPSTSTHAADSSRYWTGSGAVQVTVDEAGDGVEVTATVTAGQTYQLSCYVSPRAGGESIRIEYYDTAGTPNQIAVQNYTLPSDVDTWVRITCGGEQTAGETTAKMRVTMQGGTGAFGIDGLQIEQQDVAPTAWLDAGDDVWGSGNGIRPAGVLDYDQFLTGHTSGITFGGWFNVLDVGGGVGRYLLQTAAATEASARLSITTGDAPTAVIYASDGSLLQATGSALTAGHHHLVATYDPSSTPTLTLYVDGASAATDTTWSGARSRWDVENTTGDFSIGSNGSAGTTTAHDALIGSIHVLPYVVPASVVSGWRHYDSDLVAVTTARPTPSVMPINAYGDFLQSGHDPDGVAVYAQVDSAPHEPWFSSGTWQERGGRVAFTLFEAEKR